jgi:hypothetical protein
MTTQSIISVLVIFLHLYNRIELIDYIRCPRIVFKLRVSFVVLKSQRWSSKRDFCIRQTRSTNSSWSAGNDLKIKQTNFLDYFNWKSIFYTSFLIGIGDFFPRWCIKFVFKLFVVILLFLLLFDKDFSSVGRLCEPINERTSVTLLLTLAFECAE